ncbi:MAG: hypothetical protein HXX10_14030 [Rhodoplanes sp.]|nr:hypothetical protein [Rhodoplanes sp.]
MPASGRTRATAAPNPSAAQSAKPIDFETTDHDRIVPPAMCCGSVLRLALPVRSVLAVGRVGTSTMHAFYHGAHVFFVISAACSEMTQAVRHILAATCDAEGRGRISAA